MDTTVNAVAYPSDYICFNSKSRRRQGRCIDGATPRFLRRSRVGRGPKKRPAWRQSDAAAKLSQ
ncbi:uncharacterized protein METZ01_LOCUS457870 [marine metagenome]|uniref:Uncharacterized protein n=1 Tax=marine metagenome TaxID=408172 RepID=A0A383AAU9_9ZZZZ